MVVRGIVWLLGNDMMVFNVDLLFDVIGNGSLFGILWLVIIVVVVIVLLWFILKCMVLGIWIYVIGGNFEVVCLIGIKVLLVLLFVYGILGLFVGLGGVMVVVWFYVVNGL